MNKKSVIGITLLSAALVALSFILQARIGINYADEGYLWYGVKQTALGKIPLMDFQSYDPGRYYWAAAWSFLLGDGLMALRLSTAIFQFMGLTLGLLAARRAVRSLWALAIVGLLLVVWMHPWYKYFDVTVSLAAVFFAVRLVEKPTVLRHLSSGIFVGIAAFFGRNHGLYAFLAFLTLILFIWFRIDRRDLKKSLGACLGGIALGYSPMLFMIFFIPGFFSSFIDSVLILFRVGSTNIALPVPWPWSFDYSGRTVFVVLSDFVWGSWFLVMPLFYLFAAVSLASTKSENIRQRALLAASTFVGVFYIHYTFSRADGEHMAHGIQPLLLGMVSLPAAFGFGRKKAAVFSLAGLLSVMTVFSVAILSPYLRKNLIQRGNFVQHDVRGERFWIRRFDAYLFDSIEGVVKEHVRPGEKILLAPYLTTLYCILDKESPTQELNYLVTLPGEEQERIVRELEAGGVNWAIVWDVPIDGMEERRFRNSHSIVWRYLTEEFEPVPSPLLPNFLLLHKRDSQG